MTTAFVLAGGASLGSVQVGMLRSLDRQGVEPDLIVGTSVGAVNGAWVAAGAPISGLAEVWQGLSTTDLFEISPRALLRGLVGRGDHLVPSRGLRRVLESNLAFERLEDAPIPLTVVTADARTGEEVLLSQGPAVDAIAASAAIPGVYPPVEIGGRTLVDGGIVNNTPITAAIEAGASEVWVMSPGWSCGLDESPTTAIALAMTALGQLIEQRLELELARRSYPVPVHLLPPPCPISVTPVDFSQSTQLIDRAEAAADQWFDDGMPDTTHLFRPHLHDADGAVISRPT